VGIGECFGLPAGSSQTGRLAAALRRMGFDAVFDTNWSADLTILEEGTEFLERFKSVLSGGGASAATREKVEAAARQLGYRRPAAEARGEAGQERALALIISDLTNPYYGMLCAGAEQAARRAGRPLIVCQPEFALGAEDRAVESVVRLPVAGAVVVGAALINALRVVGKEIGEARVVINGAGSAGIAIGKEALVSILDGSYRTAVSPGVLALAAAIVSIVVKEALFWYTLLNAKKIRSGALKAEAWHHRSDALSSIGALIGIVGARAGFPVLDPLASVVICAFIGKAAFDIFRDAVDKMVDHSCDEDTEDAIRLCALRQDAVARIDLLRTREFGNRIYIEMEIAVDGDLPLRQAHAVAEKVHDEIEKRFPKVKHIMIHVNPAE
jgi:cation diffusion facilitator family transporter